MGKRPQLSLEGNQKDNFKLWETRFDSHCLTQGYRDPEKDPNDADAAEREAHYITAKRLVEIAELKQSLPDKTLKTLTETIVPNLTAEDRKKPWVYMQKLKKLFVGSPTTIADRYKFWILLKQDENHTMTDWEVNVMENIKPCNYKDSENEIMRDKFVFNLNEKYNTLRQEIFWKEQQMKDDEVMTFEQVVSHAKAYEAATTANKLVVRNSTDEHVNWTKQDRGCVYCGGPQSHTVRQCPAADAECNFCQKIGHFEKACLTKKFRQSRGRSLTSGSPNRFPRGRSSGRGQFRGERGQTRGQSWGRGRPYGQNEVHQMYDRPYDTYMYNETQETHAPVNRDEKPWAPEEKPWEPEETFATTSNRGGKRFYAHLQLSITGKDFKPIKCQIDTAATCNTIPENMLHNLQKNPPLQKSHTCLIPYGGPPIKPKGQIRLVCSRNEKFHLLNFQVLPEDTFQSKPALISGADSNILGLVDIHADEINAIHEEPIPQLSGLSKEEIIEATPDTWKGTGQLGPPVDFTLDPNVKPRRANNRRIPVAKKDKICKEIDRLVQAGRLIKVSEPTEWASNLQVREKPGKKRLCIDPSQTLNLAIQRPIYQMPTLEENLHKLKQAKCFSILDVQEAYQNIPLTGRSSYLTTMNTPIGRYRWTYMPFGINSAAEEFQMRIHEALDGIEGIVNIADDVLVYGSGENLEDAEKDHDNTLRQLLERCREKNIKLNKNKFQHKVPSLKFMGNIVSKEGLRPDPEKTTSITNMPQPTSKAATRRFLGMMTYLARFCPSLSMETKPLRDISNEYSTFLWGPAQIKAFEKCKQLVTQAPTLKYFDTNAPVTLQVDASEDGLGCALLQIGKTGELQPVAYSSSSMTKTEHHYAQIEKETLAICSAFAKWDQYLYGHPNILVHTDHQPLETIFKKPLNTAPKRLQKMMMKLQRYSFRVKYKPGSQLYLADTLSRAALQTPHEACVTGFEVFRLHLENTKTANVRMTSTTLTEIQEATQMDAVYSILTPVIVKGWPHDKNCLHPLPQPYWQFRDELTVDEGIIFKSGRALIPESLRSTLLQRIHDNHYGADSTIRMARDLIYWQGMQAAIRNMCTSCTTCLKFPKTGNKEPMMTYPIPNLPWETVSQDLFQWEGKQYLITADHYSDFFEIDNLPDTLANTIVNATKKHFARHGIPQICITDNGPQFISTQYATFKKTYHFQHITSSPYYSQSNGKAESSVKIAKNMIKKCQDLELALLNYRNTPPQGYTYSPVQRLMNRRTRTLVPCSMDLLTPATPDSSTVKSEIQARRQRAKEYYDKTAGLEKPKLQLGNKAVAKPPPHRRGSPWIEGTIIQAPTPRSYVLQTPHGPIRRNRGHIHPLPPRDVSSTSQPAIHDRSPPIRPGQELHGPPNVPGIRTGTPPTALPNPQVIRTPGGYAQGNVQLRSPGIPPATRATPNYVTKSGRVVKPRVLFDA